MLPNAGANVLRNVRYPFRFHWYPSAIVIHTATWNQECQQSHSAASKRKVSFDIKYTSLSLSLSQNHKRERGICPTAAKSITTWYQGIHRCYNIFIFIFIISFSLSSYLKLHMIYCIIFHFSLFLCFICSLSCYVIFSFLFCTHVLRGLVLELY